MIRRLLLLAALLTVLIPSYLAASDDGGTESVFNLGAGARAMGMGNGYTAIADDATAVYYNPAAMPYLASQQISFLHTSLFAGTVYDFVSYVYPGNGIGSFGIGAMRIGTDDIGRRDEFSDLGRFSATRMQMLLSYSRKIGTRFSAGGNLKLDHQAIDDYSSYGYGLDLAGRATITEKLRAGILLQDIIGSRMKLINVRERTPFTLRTGLAYDLAFDDSPFFMTAALDLEKPEDRSVKVRTGLEVAHTSGLAVRGGYDRDNVTLGLGIKYQKLNVDYAFKFIDNLSNSHRFSLTFSFGATEKERQRRRAEQIAQNRNQYIESERQTSMRQELTRADKYFELGQLDSALASYYRADAFADVETKKHISVRIAGIHSLQAQDKPAEADGTGSGVTSIIDQATELMQQGHLKAARDVVDAAINSKIDAAELFILRREIEFRIGEEINASLASAEQSFDQGNYIEAYNHYNKVLALDVNNIPARDGSRAAKIQVDIAQHLKLAMDYYDQERFVLSQREFNSVLHLDPGNETARRLLRNINDRLRDSGTQAERELRQDQEMWQVYLDGVEAYRAGDFKKAIELWDRVLKKYPNDNMTLENKRQAELRVKD